MEQAEEPSEQATCSYEQTGASEQAESAAEPMECSEPTGQTEEVAWLSDQREGSYEQVVLSSGSEARSPEPTTSEKPTQDEEFSDPWLNRFVEQLGRVPSLWRPGMHNHTGVIKEKTARGFGYMRLMTGLEPGAGGDNKTRIARAHALCRRFFTALKRELRKAAAGALELNPLASPDEALRSCPIWVRRADSFLNQMPLMVAQLNAQRQDKGKKKHPAGAAPAPSPSPPRLQVPVPPGAAGAAFVRRVVRGVRRAAKQHGFATSAAIKEVARRLGTTEDRIFQTWWGVRKLAMYKLRQAVARGDAAGGGGRLHAADWAVVDLVLLYRGEMVNESLYQNYEQLSALLGTFHLVQRFELEGNKQRVPPQDWVNAARWYSRNARGYTKNRVQMSAVALQKRWFELKQDTRRRFHAQMGGKPGLVPLPIHQAIARRYGYVVTRSAHQVWRHLVTSGQVAPPTSERGPAPGEDPVPRHVGDDDSSDSDTARAEDDDDVAIVEKTLETIDLSEDIREEDKTKEVVTTKEKAAVSSTREGLGDETGEKYKVMIVDNVTANTSDKPTVRLKKQKTSKHGNKPDKNHTASSKKTKISKQFDKTIDINKEIVDLDAPSPNTDVLEALQEFDVNNFETTIVFDSDDEDFTPNVDKTAEVPNDGNEDSVPSANDNDNESQTNNKAEKRHQRESSDSSNGNLVIDDNVHSENESSNSDAEDTNRFHEYNPNVYSNKKRKVNGGVTSKTKRSKVTVSDLMKEVTGETNDVEENEESSSDDGSRSSDSSGGKERELGEEEGSIDPKLLMYAVVLLERIDGCLLHPTSRESSKLPSPSPTREPSSPESLPIKTEHLSPSRSPIRNTSSPVPPTPERVSTPILSRITPPPPLGSPPLLSRITPSPPLGPSPLFTRNSPPPLTLFKTDPHPGSLFNFFVSTLPPKFVFNKNNIPLLRMCKFCSVVLQRIDLTDKGKMGNRVAKKVELPDIEEVRRNNRSMLTAQVAPRRARRTSGPTPSPSSGSDSDWMPDADVNLVVRRTLRRTTESGRDSRTQRLNTDESSSDSRATPRRTTDESGSDEGSRRGSQRRTADGSEFGVWRARQRVKEAELQRVLDNLAGINGEKDCDHIKSTSMRGPAAAVLSSNCSRCAARVLSAPPVSGREARLQRQLLRRAARMARVPVAIPPAAAAVSTTATPTIVVSKPPDIIHRAKYKKSKKRPHSPSLPPRPRSPPSPSPSPARAPRPRTPPSPVDAEAAAREWLRQKNIAAEKFGIKPRSYKKIAPVVQDSAPATIQPISEASTETVPRPPQNSNEITILLTNSMGGATVKPLTVENLAEHTGQVFRPASSSTTPTLFNPTAVADINKKLGALAPAKTLDFAPVLKPANIDSRPQTTKANLEFRPVVTTTRINEDFRPVINNVKSLANLPKTPVKTVPGLNMPDLNTAEPFAVLNKKDPNVSKSIIIIPSTNRNQPEKQQEAKTEENADKLPQVVNVSGGIHLPPSSVGRGLHLVVSRSPQKNTILNFQASVSQKNTILNYQPNIVVSGSVIKGVETRPKTNTPRPHSASSAAQRPPLILNSVLAGQAPPLALLSSTQLRAAPAGAAPLNNVLFSSVPGHTMHSTPMLVRSVQAGPTCAPTTLPPWARTQLPNPPPAQPPYPPPAQHRNLPPAQPLRSMQAGPAGAPRKQPPWARPQPPHPPPAQSPTNPADEEEDTSDDGEIIMSSRLELSRAPRAASAWCAGRDSAALAVLCAGAEQAGAWYVRAGARRYLLLSEQEAPPPDAEYWALRPRVRLALPGTEGDREGEPAAERPKMPDSASNPAPEPVAPAVKTSYLKVKAFARMAPEPAPASREPAPAPSEAAEAAAPRTDDTAEKLLAPARVFVNNVIYQKLSDDPLVYAKVLVAVPSSKACRALLARGAALQMYCLRSGRLYPLQAEPKKDVSRITLTGDEEISGALMALAKQLYNPSDVEEETEQESDADPEQDREHVIEIQNTTEHMLEDLEPRQQVGQAIQPTSQPSSQQNQTSKDGLASKQLRDAHSVLLNILSNKTIQIQPSPGSTVTTVTTVTTVATAPPRPPLTKPGEVIELSDED